MQRTSFIPLRNAVMKNMIRREILNQYFIIGHWNQRS